MENEKQLKLDECTCIQTECCRWLQVAQCVLHENTLSQLTDGHVTVDAAYKAVSLQIHVLPD